MGAGNVQRVYTAWSRELKPKPFIVLAYMALHARDGDADPWFGLGHEDLAVSALGLELPALDGTKDGTRKRDAVLRKVRRHVSPLLDAKAIETKQAATYGMLGHHYVVYRLYLDGPGQSTPFPSRPIR